jgi:hypothetical protein
VQRLSMGSAAVWGARIAGIRDFAAAGANAPATEQVPAGIPASD